MKKYFLIWLSVLFLPNVYLAASAPKTLLTKTLTLESPSLRSATIHIHYREDQRFLVAKTIEIVQKYFPKIHEYFNYVPRTQIHLVLDTSNYDSNGSAQVFPYNIIHLQDYPPTGDSSLIASHEWWRTLLVHEYTHVVTLEMTTGWLDTIRYVFGSTFKLAALNPRWFLEGIATWSESHFTGEGRLYHPSISASVANLLNNPDFCQDFSCWDSPAIYPHGSAAYWLGASFLNYVETKKPNTLSCWAKLNSHVIPFFVNGRFTECFGKDIYATYQDFKTEYLKDHQENTCPFQDNKACDSLNIFKSSKNYFKGVLENKHYVAMTVNVGQKGSGSSYGSEQLFFYDKSKNLASRLILPYTVEQLYQANDKNFLIIFQRPGWTEGRRTFAQFDIATKKLTFFPNKICELPKEDHFAVVSYLFTNEKEFLCMRYSEQSWQVGVGDVGEWKQRYSFAQGEQIYAPTAIKNEKGWVLKYTSKPPLPEFEKKSIGAFTKPQWKQIELKNDITEKTNSPEVQNIADEHNYQPWYYFYPNYLMLEIFSSGTVDSYGVSTGMSDPRSRHLLDFTLLYNDGLSNNQSHFSGFTSYTYHPNNWISQILYSKLHLLFDQDTIEKHHVQEQTLWMLGYEFEKELWKITPSINLGRADESDPYSSRKLLKSYLSTRFEYLNQAPSTVLKLATLNVDAGVSENKNFDTYTWTTLVHSQVWQWNEDFRSHLNLHYGKMFLEDGTNLRDGTFYGGGAPALFTYAYPFPSYLLGYGNLLGSELVTGQLRQDWNFYYPFIGNGLIPFYLKSVGAVFGFEYLQGKYMYYDDFTELDPRLWVGFAGTKFSTQLFFLLPVDIELIYARSLDGRRLRSNLSLALQTSITF